MKLEPKHFFFYAVLPALIAGVFSIAPKLYEIVTEPKASLQFLATAGPVVRLPSGVKQIISVSVWNGGRKPLGNVKLKLDAKPGTTIEASTLQQHTALSYKIADAPNSSTYEVAGLLPGEKFSVAAMLTSEVAIELPQVAARSNETLGVTSEVQLKPKSSKLDFVGASLASLSVLVMSLALSFKVRSGGFPGIGGKQDVLFFIPARLELPEIANEMRLADTSLSYLRMADILLAHGLNSDGAARERAVTALKCLLLIQGIAERSLDVIKGNLRILEGEDFSQDEFDLLREKSVSVSEQEKLRERINGFISAASAFLTSPPNA